MEYGYYDEWCFFKSVNLPLLDDQGDLVDYIILSRQY